MPWPDSGKITGPAMTSVSKTMKKDQGGSVGTFRGDYYRSGRHGGLVSKSEIFDIKAIFNTSYHISLVQQNHSNKLRLFDLQTDI